MPLNRLVGGARLVEQAVSNVLYASAVPLRTKQTLAVGMAMLG
jgi:hypothetical protein